MIKSMIHYKSGRVESRLFNRLSDAMAQSNRLNIGDKCEIYEGNTLLASYNIKDFVSNFKGDDYEYDSEILQESEAVLDGCEPLCEPEGM